MGLFSSKKKHYVDTSVVRVVEDEMVPNPIETALVNSLFKDMNISDSLQDQALNGAHRNFEKMYRFAAAGNYYYGLPNSRLLSTGDGFDEAKAAIESETGETVTIEYMHFRPLNNIHAGFKHCMENLGYYEDSNELTTLSTTHGFTTYLNKMVAVTQSTEATEFEPAESPERSSQGTFEAVLASGRFHPDRPKNTADSGLQHLHVEQEIRIGTNEIESVEIHWTYEDGAGDLINGVIVLDLTGYDSDQEYYQAKYTTASMADGEAGYWTYDPLTGIHGTLNDILKPLDSVTPGTYFPFVLLRSEKSNRGDDSLVNTEEFKSASELMEFLGMDFKEMADAIDEDGDAKKLDQAAMVMAVPVNSQNEIEINYLFRYFDRLVDGLPAEANILSRDLQKLTSKSAASDVSYAVQITDADFNMTISFDKVYRYKRAEQIGPVGTVSNTTEFDEFTPAGLSPAGMADYSKRVIKKQITPYVVQTIVVKNPQVRYIIYKNKGAEGGFEDERCLIPLDYTICKQINTLKKQELYYRSLYLIFNSHVVVKKKWYESGIFKAIMVVVAVVVTIYTAGGGAFVSALISGTATTAMVVALAQAIVTNIITGFLIQVAVDFAVEQLGIDFAFYLAVAAALAGGVKMIQAGSLTTSTSATNLLKASTSLTKGIKNEMESLVDEYQDDVQEFETLKETKLAELEETKALLDTGIDINPFVFIGQEPLTVWGEPPSAYLNRTVHAGNVGMAGVELIENFVDVSLRLPSTQETIGDTFYG